MEALSKYYKNWRQPREAEIHPTLSTIRDIFPEDVVREIQSFRAPTNEVLKKREQDISDDVSKLHQDRDREIDEIEREYQRNSRQTFAAVNAHYRMNSSDNKARKALAKAKKKREILSQMKYWSLRQEFREKIEREKLRERREREKLRDLRTAERQKALAQFPNRPPPPPPHQFISGRVTNSMDPRAAAMD